MLLYAPFLLLLSQLAEGAKKPCQQEPAFVGPCRAAKPRWTYQQDRNTCSEFQYGGCKGNENNFNTQADCERACLVAPKTEDAGGEEKTACEQEPAIVGPCRASKPRWTFRPTLGECVEFTYGGCDGNENNFESKQACEASCGGPTQADPKTPAEQREEAGENVDICQLLPFAPEPQLCRASIQAFSYDYQKRQCMEFMYGGCEGNANNFESMEECEAACPPVPQCEQPPFSPTPQICRASLTAYSYNPETGACEDYVFGGCGENLNHFGTKEECEASCISQQKVVAAKVALPTAPARDESEEPCEQTPYAPQPQICRASLHRYTFDPAKGMCVKFVFGGCKGNANNFETQAECEKACLPTPTTTTPPPTKAKDATGGAGALAASSLLFAVAALFA